MYSCLHDIDNDDDDDESVTSVITELSNRKSVTNVSMLGTVIPVLRKVGSLAPVGR